MENEIATSVIYENVIYLPYGNVIEVTIKQRKNTLNLRRESPRIQTLAGGSSCIRSIIDNIEACNRVNNPISIIVHPRQLEIFKYNSAFVRNLS